MGRDYREGGAEILERHIAELEVTKIVHNGTSEVAIHETGYHALLLPYHSP